MNYILDTNVVSELTKKQPNPNVVQWVDSQDPTRLYVTVITIGEIRKGIKKLPPSARKDALYAWLFSHLFVRFDGRILSVTTEAMLQWGELMGRLEAKGIVISAVDSFIAAIALQGTFTIATRNTDDFRETGVSLINPWEIS
jgi:toxin FitB